MTYLQMLFELALVNVCAGMDSIMFVETNGLHKGNVIYGQKSQLYVGMGIPQGAGVRNRSLGRVSTPRTSFRSVSCVRARGLVA